MTTQHSVSNATLNSGRSMMKRLLALMLVFVASATMAFAQRYTVKGIVIDKDIAEPLLGANVQLIDGSGAMVTGIQTGDDGSFEIPVNTRGKHSLKVTFIGFLPKTIALDSKNVKNKQLEVGYITMEADSKLLDEATVMGAAAKVQVSGDSIVFNPSAYRVPQGSTLEALVKLLPGAQVDDSGNITINGKTVNKILVDGKEFFLNDKEMAMKNIPVDMVDRIKSYERKSDLARVTGIDDGEEETVLDLTVKKGMNNGWFGNVTAGAGTENRYNGRAMVNRFTDNLQATLVTNARNIREGWGWQRSQGLNSYKEVGGNFATDSKHLETGGSVTYRYNGTDSWSLGNTEQFNALAAPFSVRENQSYSGNHSVNTQFRFEWKPTEMTNILFRPNLTMSRNHGSTWNNTFQYESDPEELSEDEKVAQTFLTNYVRSQSYSEDLNANGELQFNQKFNDKGRNLTVRVTGNFKNSESENISANQALYKLSYMNRTNNNYYSTPSSGFGYNTQFTYSEPIADRTYLQFSYQYGYSYSKNDRQAQVYDSEAYRDLYDAIRDNRYDIESVLDRMEALHHVFTNQMRADSLSQFSEYRNYNHTIGLQFRRIREQYQLNAGFDLMPQSTNLEYRYLAKDYNIDRHVFNWSPRLHLRWNFNKHTDLQIRYNGRSQQPSMTNLLAILDDTNTMNTSVGNPELDPSFSHTLRGNYHTYNAETQGSLFLFLNGSATQNAIKTMTTYVKAGGQVTKPMNVNGDWNAGVGMGFNRAFGERKFYTLGGMVRTNYGHDVGYFANIETRPTTIEQINAINPTRSLTKNFTLGGDLRAAYRNEQFNIELNGGTTWVNGRNNVNVEANKNNYNFNYGGRFEWTAPWGTEISTDLNMQSRRGYGRADMNTDECIWNAAIQHSFLRGRVLTIRAEAFDILGQQSNVSRVINAMQVSDTHINAVNQYAMLTLTYRFSIFGGKNAIGTKEDKSNQLWGGPMGGRGGRPQGPPPGGMRPGGMMRR